MYARQANTEHPNAWSEKDYLFTDFTTHREQAKASGHTIPPIPRPCSHLFFLTPGSARV